MLSIDDSRCCLAVVCYCRHYFSRLKRRYRCRQSRPQSKIIFVVVKVIVNVDVNVGVVIKIVVKLSQFLANHLIRVKIMRFVTAARKREKKMLRMSTKMFDIRMSTKMFDIRVILRPLINESLFEP